MRKAYVWWDSDFRREFQKPLLDSIDYIKNLGGSLEVKRVGNFSRGNGDFMNADWYFKDNYDSRRRQVNAGNVLARCTAEPWQKQEEHLEVIGTSYDLWTGGDDNVFVFGGTWPGFGTITSSNRMERYYGRNAPQVYFTLSLHEDAHLFGAPDENRRNDLEHILGWHCKLEDCTMGQVNVQGRPDALQATRNILRRYERTGNYFCDDCTEDVVNGIKRLT
ncbi:MAG: hypothetical protein ACW96U_11700 [Candidatus Heimdallarchaeaceae archaeon]